MPIDSVLLPFAENALQPDAPYRSATLRHLIGQTQCAGLVMSGNRKVYACNPGENSVNVLLGSTAYDIVSFPWSIQNGFDEIEVNAIFAVNVALPFRFRLVCSTLIDAIATTTGEYIAFPSWPKQSADNNNNWDDEPLLFGNETISIIPAELPASRRVLLTLQVACDAVLSGLTAGDEFAIKLRQMMIFDKRASR